ncbi:hypothetical protein CANMA_002385 [Candida margitis]|uniref:uncharacterized protein n=1 Tax=Candida margitis TaxID=1775924 RepID=UPI0022268EDB|nr:uncharacterized protein CANMA_002385 [Candida margitis]KAI5968394.1 hypothetical protein CANMA_002385 [Candida margitis]
MYQQPNHSYSSSDSLRRLSSNNPFRQYQPSPAPIQPQSSSSSLQMPQHGLGYQNANNSHNSILAKHYAHSPRKASTLSNQSTSSAHFDEWVAKNRQLVDGSDDEELYGDPETDSQVSPNKILSYYQNNNASLDSNIGGHGKNARRYSRINSGGSATNQGPQYVGSFNEHQSNGYSRPIKPQAIRSDSDSSVSYSNRAMKSNNPFVTSANEPEELVQPQIQREREPQLSPPRHSNTPPARPPKPAEGEFAPPSYEEAAGPEAAKREYRREKEPGSSSHSTRQHRSHSDSHHHRSHRKSSSSRHHKSSSSRNKSPSKRKPEVVPAKNMDTIDKLDVTGFFGGGFHHDGPFDACTPHRNKNSKKAPVMAFPADGPNNSIAGAGNFDKNQQMNLAFGYDEANDSKLDGEKSHAKAESKEAVPLIKTNRVSNDPQTSIYTPKQNPSVINFDSTQKAEPVHGSTTAGLGSTTFLDGAPAPRGADDFLAPPSGGLGRKKSLVQRFKGNGSSNTSRRNSNDDRNSGENVRRGSLNALDIDTGDDDDLKPSRGNSLIRRVKSLKVKR